VADGDPVLGLQLLGELEHDRKRPLDGLVEVELPLEAVLRLGEPVALEQLLVVRVVPVLEDLGLQLVALHEQAAFVVRAEVHRADDPIAIAAAQPALGARQESRRHALVVLAFEEAEQAPVVALELVEAPVHVGADAADGPAVPPGEEVLGLGVLEERVLRAVEVPLALRDQRRHPVRRVPVERKHDELPHLAAARDRPDLDARGARALPRTRCARRRWSGADSSGGHFIGLLPLGRPLPPRTVSPMTSRA
jgi:hypothetical protein